MKISSAGLAAGILLVGWVISVGIRSWQKVPVDIGPEMLAAAMAASLIYAKMSGRGGDGGEEKP